MFKVIRETKWIVEYETPLGTFVDSKFRTYACEASCEEFIAAWELADAKTKEDLEHAFLGLSYPADRQKILAYISGKEGAHAASKMIAQFKAIGSDTQSNQYCHLLHEQALKENSPHRLVGKNQWFEVYVNPAGRFYIETVDFDSRPNDRELLSLEAAADNRAYKDAIRIIRDNRFLIS